MYQWEYEPSNGLFFGCGVFFGDFFFLSNNRLLATLCCWQHNILKMHVRDIQVL